MENLINIIKTKDCTKLNVIYKGPLKVQLVKQGLACTVKKVEYDLSYIG